MPYKILINELLCSGDASVRLALAKACRCKDINDYSRLLSKLAEDPEEEIRIEVAAICAAGKNLSPRCKSILETLAKDPSDDVRMTVAKTGADSSLFITDKNPHVRAAAAKNCHDNSVLMQFAKDSNFDVACSVIAVCKDKKDPISDMILDEYMKENHVLIKKELAKIGYKIQELLADASFEVRNAAESYMLTNMQLT